MAKNVKKILNELIDETKSKSTVNDGKRISLFDIPVEKYDYKRYSVNLNDVVIFDGVDVVIANLIEGIKDACFIGQTDISVSIPVERDVCMHLYDFGIRRVFFYSPIENLEQLPLFLTQISEHIRYIFNSLQSPVLYSNFLGEDNRKEAQSLLFPFNRDDENDETGMHYLVEKLHGSYFLRITAEDSQHSRLNLRRVNYRSVSCADVREQYQNGRVDASVIYSSLISHSRNNKLSYRDSGLQLGRLISYLKNIGYTSLSEITVNWPREIIIEFLVEGGKRWYEIISRLLMMLPDSTTLRLLNGGGCIEVNYNDAKVFLSLTQRSRNIRIDIEKEQKAELLDDYLVRMEQLERSVSSFTKRLENTHVLFIHHFTNETLAVLGAFERLKVHSVDSLWVKYSGSIPPKYLETILALSGSVYNFYGLQQVVNEEGRTTFRISNQYSSIDKLNYLQDKFMHGAYEFYTAMQKVGMHLFIQAIMNVQEGIKIIVAEDGGYIAPLINRLCLEKRTLAQVCDFIDFDKQIFSDAGLETSFFEWIAPFYSGSVEHTRNGYDALADVESQFNELAFPACSLAVSNFKVNDESVEVAQSCMSAIEMIMNGQGFVLNNRQVLVIGSLGAIGGKTMNILSQRISHSKIAGVDIKELDVKYNWLQVQYPGQVPVDFLDNTDLIFGVVGKSVLTVEFFESLILKTTRKNIFMASGSTKRFEFLDFLNWVDCLHASKKPEIRGEAVKLKIEPIEDPQTSAILGSCVRFELMSGQVHKIVNFYLMSNLMPVNFQYYGVPRETMDAVMTEFVSMVHVVSQSKVKKLPSKLLALDHSIRINGDLI